MPQSFAGAKDQKSIELVPAPDAGRTAAAPMSPVPMQYSDSISLTSIIADAASNPAVDVDKLERLISLRTQIKAKDAERAFDAAMTATQGEMRPVAADSNNPQTKSRYASYFALDKALRPIYTKNGFSLSFNTATGAGESMVRVMCRVSHRDGHGRDYQIDMPADGKGAKGGDVMTKTHATGSAVSYGQRYLLKMIFNISVGADDDGNAASQTIAAISDEQVQELSNLLTETKSNLVLFLKKIKVESLTEIRADKFNDVVKLIKETARKRAEREAEAQKQGGQRQ